jgi:hypothetical protein
MEVIAGLKRIRLWILLLPGELSVSQSSLWKIWFEVCHLNSCSGAFYVEAFLLAQRQVRMI